MEQTAYDFSKAIQKMEGRNHKTIESFTITEAAIWVTTGEYLYRMDLQTETITGATMRYEDGTTYSLATLYTDGKEIYGVNAEGYVVKQEVAVVHILTDSMSDTKTVEVKVEALTE